jgi:hypothetical protein
MPAASRIYVQPTSNFAFLEIVLLQPGNLHERAKQSFFQGLICVDGDDDSFTSTRRREDVMAALNGAIGLSDMAGKAARVAVEPSGSERDTTPAFSLNGADGTSDTRRRRDWDSRG